jgi:hypothetical protein
MAEVTLAGLTLTQDDWESLDEESKAFLLESLGWDDPAEEESYYESYEIYIEELPREQFD